MQVQDNKLMKIGIVLVRPQTTSIKRRSHSLIISLNILFDRSNAYIGDSSITLMYHCILKPLFYMSKTSNSSKPHMLSYKITKVQKANTSKGSMMIEENVTPRLACIFCQTRTWNFLSCNSTIFSNFRMQYYLLLITQ